MWKWSEVAVSARELAISNDLFSTVRIFFGNNENSGWMRNYYHCTHETPKKLITVFYTDFTLLTKKNNRKISFQTNEPSEGWPSVQMSSRQIVCHECRRRSGQTDKVFVLRRGGLERHIQPNRRTAGRRAVVPAACRCGKHSDISHLLPLPSRGERRR